MRVLICGSRTFTDPDGVIEALVVGMGNQHYWRGDKLTVITGGARGADRLADDAASRETGSYCEREVYEADWDRHGKRAGYVRNQRMLDEGKPDLVVAFVDKPLAESKGTAMMVDIARKAGVLCYVVERST